MCQKVLKCANNPDNYCLGGRATTQPCLEECLGGCETRPGNCRACKHAMNDGKCVSQCPPPLIVSREESRTVANPEFKYNFHDICVKNCPGVKRLRKQVLIQFSILVFYSLFLH
ncbi:tyrosine kinase [Schistosoma mansoni]|uniref:tyrosine kinase n=1 Tax=Schistosoma mansoni TaxID=6183 RepID=UPI00022DCC4D|nr:tyrosine kinase [Schistosoma mansoni]|eukprot:XP_018654336.1 tyrosine kinase [Schistosoma mansoni]